MQDQVPTHLHYGSCYCRGNSDHFDNLSKGLLVGSRSKEKLPPGPHKLPFFGNLFQLPKTREYLTYQKWSNQYGSDIIHLSILGQSLIILNSSEAVSDLLEQRSLIYSGSMGWKWAFPFLPYGRVETLTNCDMFIHWYLGKQWKEQRKVFHREFNPDAVARFRNHETEACMTLIGNLQQSPNRFIEHIRHFSGQLILKIAYGISVQTPHDQEILISERSVESISLATTPGQFFVDSIPLLQYVPSWFPLAGFKRMAIRCSEDSTWIRNELFQKVKLQLESGLFESSVTSRGLKNISESQDATYLQGVLKDTTSSLVSFILEMARHPNVQQKAYEEICCKTGTERLPTLSDKSDLPYITAILMEVLRRHPVAPCNAPHVLTEQDHYKEFMLPANSIVLVNTWAILHNPNIYSDPLQFDPDRFVKDGQLLDGHKHPITACFGYGRRICPGRYMALESMWIAIAFIIAKFKIEPSRNPDGSIVEITGESTSGIITRPKPFECSIKSRQEYAES
ncbi:cytochrome P450 [Dendrothele bispora CBS 962.96]|uniref:Cytochrome P450 n=1 Tax=Dendrothele bispora (strain CBS 962.96) TaxID=1314807 RepID=A0A4S8LUL3_DENBC|nr:cytochrome P450 [Dendrothele bispora CBS 962.96]